jgi:uncharacterized protein YoxC
MEMADILYIAGGLALLALASLLFYTITLLRETRTMITDTNKNINELVQHANKQLEAVDGIVANVNELADDLTDVVDDAVQVVHQGRNVVVSLLDFEQTAQKALQEPIIEVLHVFGALGKGIRAFRHRLSDRMEGNTLSTNGRSAGVESDTFEKTL